MSKRHGDFDYETHGQGYAVQRQPDPRIAAHIHAALGDARTVLNIGAGAGSYEPTDRHVIAIEPSPVMRAQRPAHLAPAIDGVAEALPLDDQSVDAAMATVTLHQWSDVRKGLSELRRVTRGPVVVLSFDPSRVADFWMNDYAPELMQVEARRYPDMPLIAEALGGQVEILSIAVPQDCSDGFQEAFYARPEAFLQPHVRRGQSAWSFLPPGIEERAVAALSKDLRSGAWERRHGALRKQAAYCGALRLVVGRP